MTLTKEQSIQKIVEWKKQNKNRVQEYYAKERARRKQQLKDYLSDKCCLQCGEKRSPCLDFHHRDPKEKDGNVSRLNHNGVKWEKVLKEIAKCDILCRNCHAMIHFSEK